MLSTVVLDEVPELRADVYFVREGHNALFDKINIRVFPVFDLLAIVKPDPVSNFSPAPSAPIPKGHPKHEKMRHTHRTPTLPS